MPAMLDLPDLPASVEITLQIALIALAALVGFLVVRAGVGISVRHLLERRREETGTGTLPQAELERRVRTIGTLVVRVAGAVLAIIAVLMALDLFGIDIGPAVAGLGVVGIALGFGAQTLVRDWLAGIFIVLENQFSAGDMVRLVGVEGVVEDFSLRRTTLRDLDGTLHVVPNGQIIVASNLARLWAYLTLDIGVAADTDLDRASNVVGEVGEELKADAEWGPRLLAPPQVVRIGASAGTVRVQVQVRATDQKTVGDELRLRILAAFDRAGIEVLDPDHVAVRQGGAEAETGHE
jgi:moderate conductance mechanosensitive channel